MAEHRGCYSLNTQYTPTS